MSSCEDNDNGTEVQNKQRKRVVRNVSTYKKEVIKRSRLLGEEYVNTRGVVVQKKSNTDENCDCKEQCKVTLVLKRS